MNKNIGAQFYTIRDYCQTLEDFDNSCKRVSEMGYKVVQLSGIGDFTGDEVKEILDKYGLVCACTHRGRDSYVNNIEKEIQFHKTIGCKVCGLGYNGDVEESGIDAFVRDFRPVCDKLAENGMVFAYHNHALEFEKRNGRFILEEMIEKMNHSSFKLILDVYWLAYAGVNPAQFIRKHKDMIACIHYKDMKIEKNTQKMAEVGQGNIDWDDVIAAAEESAATYALVEQDTCDGDPFDSLKISYDYLKGKGYC